MRDSRESPLQAGDLQPLAAGRLRGFETLLLTALIPAARVAFGWDDPFLLEGAFPWLAFVPLAIGVQHGLAYALASVVLSCAGVLVHAMLAGGDVPAPAFAVAWCAIAAIAGRACDAQSEKTDRLRRRVLQLERAIAKEKSSRHVLQLSHERLVEQLAGVPGSVQASVVAALERLAGFRSARELGRSLLDLLAQHAELQRGAVFAVDGNGTLLEWPVATLGRAPETRAGGAGDWACAANSPLVVRAVRTRRLTSVVDGDGLAGATGEVVLAALPLLAADARLLGIVAMTQLPFAAFHPGALGRAFVLVSGVTSELEPARWWAWIAEIDPGNAGDGTGGSASVTGPQRRATWGSLR